MQWLPRAIQQVSDLGHRTALEGLTDLFNDATKVTFDACDALHQQVEVHQDVSWFFKAVQIRQVQASFDLDLDGQPHSSPSIVVIQYRELTSQLREDCEYAPETQGLVVDVSAA